MKYDIWQSERERSEVLECGLKALRDEWQNNGKTAFGLKLWFPKATKPFANYLFRNAESRDAYLQQAVDRRKAHVERTEQRKVERAGSPEDMTKVQEGDIFCYSWGYDQTNVEFFQVIKKCGRHVTLLEVSQQTVPGSQGFMSETVKAVKGSFLSTAKPITKLVTFLDGHPCLSMDHGHCGKWHGKAHYSSHYA